MQVADMVISHCGAGTILEILNLKKKAIGVINPGLMDNHQEELAEAMKEQNLMHIASDPSKLKEALATSDWNSLKSRDSSENESTVLLDEISTMISL
jgi:beta-1,4-N-acetylglucosaminyltransferase